METMKKTETALTDSFEVKKITNINLKRIILGLCEIGDLEIEDFQTNIGISKTIANLSVAEKSYSKTLNSIMKKHIKKNEAGNFMIENNFYVFLSDDDKLQYEQSVEKLNETEVSENVYKIKTSVLKNTKGVKASMMAKCYELIDDDIQPEKKE